MLKKYVIAAFLFGTIFLFPAYAENTMPREDDESIVETSVPDETEDSIDEKDAKKEAESNGNDIRFVVKKGSGEVIAGRTIYIKDTAEKQLAAFSSGSDENGVTATKDGEPIALPVDELLYACTEKTAGVYSPAVEFTISKDQSDDIRIELFEYAYNTLEVSTYVEGTKEKVSATYAVYRDPEGAEQAKDVYGKKTEGTIFDLAPGEYFLKEKSSGEKYYKNEEIIPFSIRENEKCEMIRYVKPVIMSLSSSFTEGTPEGTIELLDSKGNSLQSVPISKEKRKLQLQRNSNYTLQVSPVNGYYPISPIHFHTGETVEEEIEQSIPFERTHVMIMAMDETTSMGIEGAGIEIYDAQGNDVTAFLSKKDGNLISGLHAGEKYEIREKTAPLHYLSITSHYFEVPVSGQEPFRIALPHTPYVSLLVSVAGGTNGAEYTIYDNAACTKKAVDIRGHSMMGTYQGEEIQYDVKNGTYYLKITSPSLYCYPTDEVFAVTADHTQNSAVSVTGQEVKAEYRFAVKSSANGEMLAGTLVEIKDETGKETIAKWSLSSNEAGDLPSLDHSEVNLEPGKVYQINTVSLASHYWRKNKSVRFITAAKKPEKVPCFTFQAEPFVSYTLKSNRDLATYALYLDEACTNQAKDIYGNRVTLKSGQMSADLSEGTYWLKMQDHVIGCYHDPEVHEIQLSMEHGFEVKQDILLDPIQLSIVVEDENDEMLAGAQIEVLNQEGTVLDTWITENKPHLFAGDQVFPGEEIYIHQVAACQGYEPLEADLVVTIPETSPSEIQTIYMKNEQIPITKQDRMIREWINPGNQEITEDEVIHKKQHTKVPVYASLAAGIVCFFVGFRRYQQMKWKNRG